jgi:hypothetical protein
MLGRLGIGASVIVGTVCSAWNGKNVPRENKSLQDKGTAKSPTLQAVDADRNRELRRPRFVIPTRKARDGTGMGPIPADLLRSGSSLMSTRYTFEPGYMFLLLYMYPSIAHNFEAALSASVQHSSNPTDHRADLDSSLSAAKTGFNLQNLVLMTDPAHRHSR